MANIEQAPIGMQYPEQSGRLGAALSSRGSVPGVRAPALPKTTLTPYKEIEVSPLQQIAHYGAKMVDSLSGAFEKMKEQDDRVNYLNAMSEGHRALENRNLQNTTTWLKNAHDDNYEGDAGKDFLDQNNEENINSFVGEVTSKYGIKNPVLQAQLKTELTGLGYKQYLENFGRVRTWQDDKLSQSMDNSLRGIAMDVAKGNDTWENAYARSQKVVEDSYPLFHDGGRFDKNKLLDNQKEQLMNVYAEGGIAKSLQSGGDAIEFANGLKGYEPERKQHFIDKAEAGMRKRSALDVAMIRQDSQTYLDSVFYGRATETDRIDWASRVEKIRSGNPEYYNKIKSDEQNNMAVGNAIREIISDPDRGISSLQELAKQSHLGGMVDESGLVPASGKAVQYASHLVGLHKSNPADYAVEVARVLSKTSVDKDAMTVANPDGHSLKEIITANRNIQIGFGEKEPYAVPSSVEREVENRVNGQNYIKAMQELVTVKDSVGSDFLKMAKRLKLSDTKAMSVNLVDQPPVLVQKWADFHDWQDRQPIKDIEELMKDDKKLNVAKDAVSTWFNSEMANSDVWSSAAMRKFIQDDVLRGAISIMAGGMLPANAPNDIKTDPSKAVSYAASMWSQFTVNKASGVGGIIATLPKYVKRDDGKVVEMKKENWDTAYEQLLGDALLVSYESQPLVAEKVNKRWWGHETVMRNGKVLKGTDELKEGSYISTDGNNVGTLNPHSYLMATWSDGEPVIRDGKKVIARINQSMQDKAMASSSFKAKDDRYHRLGSNVHIHGVSGRE